MTVKTESDLQPIVTALQAAAAKPGQNAGITIAVAAVDDNVRIILGGLQPGGPGTIALVQDLMKAARVTCQDTGRYLGTSDEVFWLKKVALQRPGKPVAEPLKRSPESTNNE